ncbi:CDP-alcohol phosphatidyltransferase family protein [Azospira restricta]|uniref:CDP-alcohol phosphatidyltransferase family protein n=1 Tax=Azospira restricta TaxID=404405 RepID=A0A974SPI7_9RHOO|nr:CDP-alcohol phosphatidyltransferase family protein [Azospira restricta]QRJ64060.1 CDP-alcohol phosphatidyltransferase family protein [Azospira restricta]
MSGKSVIDIFREIKRGYYGSRKNVFDAEHYFFRWYRPVSFYPTAVLIKHGVSANAVTGFGAICLLVAFAMLATGQLMLGALLYLFAYLIDFMDGNIARYAGHPTFFGKMIDGLVDSLTFLLFMALALGNARYGNPVFGASVELFLGVATAFGFLFRAYFYVRLTFILSQVPQGNVGSEGEASAGQGGVGSPAVTAARPLFLRYGKKFYFGLISGMPVLLVLAVLLRAVSVYLAVYFALFVLATLFEVVYGLVRVRRKDA